MSDRDSNNEPLFQNMDEQERIYAPQQIPDDQIDSGEDIAERDDDVVPASGVVPGAGGITGSSGGSAGVAGIGGLVAGIPKNDVLDPDNERQTRREDDSERL